MEPEERKAKQEEAIQERRGRFKELTPTLSDHETCRRLGYGQAIAKFKGNEYGEFSTFCSLE